MYLLFLNCIMSKLSLPSYINVLVVPTKYIIVDVLVLIIITDYLISLLSLPSCINVLVVWSSEGLPQHVWHGHGSVSQFSGTLNSWFINNQGFSCRTNFFIFILFLLITLNFLYVDLHPLLLTLYNFYYFMWSSFVHMRIPMNLIHYCWPDLAWNMKQLA